MKRPFFAVMKGYIRSPGWMISFLIATALFFLMYLLNAIVSEINPGNWWGLTYGTGASLLMGGAALLGVRRRSMKFAARISLGTSERWLQFHLYAGTLSMLLVFMHSRFSIPAGALNWWLWLLSIWVTLSG